jgi:carboxyl-terminal processing protease
MRLKTVFIFLLILPFSLINCRSEKTKNNSIEGIWQSVGYGRILEIDSISYSVYDITEISCTESKTGNSSDFNDVIRLKNDTLSIQRGLSTYYYTRLNAKPELCSSLNEDKTYDIEYNFEVFANTLKEHYAYFELNNINWDDFYQTYRSKITEETSEVELYLIMDEMISTLNDNHGSIEPKDEIYERAESLSTSNDTESNLKWYGDFEIANLVAEQFIDEDLTKDSWLIKWGKLHNNIGYIQIKAMMLHGDLDLPEALIEDNGFVQTYFNAFESLSGKEQIKTEVNGVRRTMNNVMKDLKDTKHIIIDVRFNGGGNDEVSLEILRHFNPSKKLVASKKTRLGDDFTKTLPVYLDSSIEAYTKPVFLLTSQQSASATDMMALSSLELNNFTLIGSHTQGAVSDALQKKLPNGWHFTLSNEVYMDIKGTIYENIGIPVEYELNYPSDRQTFFRSVANDLEADKNNILKAISELSNR